MLTLALALALSQTTQPMLFRQPNLPQSAAESFAFFEFAPASGTGMTDECACTTPTGAKGEALTFTRTGAATCTKGTDGRRTTGIADGDLVSCATNEPRVMRDADGVRGLLVEGARTNINVRSEEWNNAAYTLTGTGAAAPSTPTANTAVAPDGATTADTVTFNATTTGQNSLIRAAIGGACASAQCAYSVYVRGVSGSGTVDMGAWGSTVSTAPCAYVDTSWTRCVVIASVAGTPGIFVGNTTANNGGTDRPTQSLYVWGGQQEVGTFASSYIPTTSAAVTRNAERALFTLPMAVSQSASSHAVSITTEWSNPNGPLGYGITYGANASPIYGLNDVRVFDSTTQVVLATTWTAGVTKRVWSSYSGALQTIDNGSTSTTGAYDGNVPTTTTLELGSQGLGSNVWFAIYTRVCVDPDPLRCR